MNDTSAPKHVARQFLADSLADARAAREAAWFSNELTAHGGVSLQHALEDDARAQRDVAALRRREAVIADAIARLGFSLSNP